MLFDRWYARLANRQQVRALDWPWLTRLKRTRLVHPAGQALKPLAEWAVGPDGQRVWLNGYGPSRVFRLDNRAAGDTLAIAQIQPLQLGELAERQLLLWLPWSTGGLGVRAG